MAEILFLILCTEFMYLFVISLCCSLFHNISIRQVFVENLLITLEYSVLLSFIWTKKVLTFYPLRISLLLKCLGIKILASGKGEYRILIGVGH